MNRLDRPPKKSLGQNFCIDRNILHKIFQKGQITKDDFVIEIGAGTGALSEHLAPVGSELALLEIDKRFAPALDKLKNENEKVSIHYGDALKIFPKVIKKAKKPVVVMGNLPYHISSQLIFMFIENRGFIKRAVITLQLEMAKRLTAQTSTKDYGILTVRTKAVANAELLFKIAPTAFFPKPKVNSACAKIEFREDMKGQPDNEKLFKKVVKASFSQRRKQLKNSLSGYFETEKVLKALAAARIRPESRAEELDYKQFLLITEEFEKI